MISRTLKLEAIGPATETLGHVGTERSCEVTGVGMIKGTGFRARTSGWAATSSSLAAPPLEMHCEEESTGGSG